VRFGEVALDQIRRPRCGGAAHGHANHADRALVLSLDGKVDLTTVHLLAEVIDSVLAEVGPRASR
jgi:hypothetical protein